MGGPQDSHFLRQSRWQLLAFRMSAVTAAVPGMSWLLVRRAQRQCWRQVTLPDTMFPVTVTCPGGATRREVR